MIITVNKKNVIKNGEGEYIIELTKTQELDIYYKVQHDIDLEDIEDAIRECDDVQFYDDYGVKKEYVTDEMKEKMADRMRHFLSNDDTWIYLRDDAIRFEIEEEQERRKKSQENSN